MIQDVYIIGATGKVGSALVRQIIEKGDVSDSRHANPTRIVGLASREWTIYSPIGISKQRAYAFAGRDYNGAQRYLGFDDLLGIVNQGRNDGSALVFVDVTEAGEPMIGFHLHVIRQTSHGMVTANKNPLASAPFPIFQELTKHPGRYGYRCSVMAGAEAVPFLQDLRDLNDHLFTVEGCLSGTIGYLTSELERSKPFSMILREAHAKGYTEPHPGDDLSGLDVARKLCILARTAGFRVSMEDIKVTPFIPREFLLESDVNRFLDSVKSIDTEFAEMASRAEANGMTLRYVARMDARGKTLKLEVSLQEVPRESRFGRLNGTTNMVVVTSEAYPDGYSIESAGAGLEVTARNIRRDLLHLLPGRSL